MYKILNFLTSSAIWIAICGVFWIAILSQLAGRPFQPVAALILVLVTFAIYLYDHASGSREDLLNTPGRAWLAKYPAKQIAFVAYGLAVLITCRWDISRLPHVIVPGIAGALYTAQIGSVRPKDLPGMKTLIVATSTSVCRAGLVYGAAWLYVLVFLIMIIDTVLCDLRDLSGDRASGVRTIPVIFGRKQTLLILSLIDVLIFYFSPIIAIIGICLIWYFRKERSTLTYDLLVDGWMLWALLIESVKYFRIVQFVVSI